MSQEHYQEICDDLLGSLQKARDLRQRHAEVWAEWDRVMADRRRCKAAGETIPFLFDDERHKDLETQIFGLHEELRQLVEAPRLEGIRLLELHRGLTPEEGRGRKGTQMQKSIQGTLVVIAVLLGAIVFGLFTQRVQSQSPPLQTINPSAAGRYQLIIAGDSESVFDTQTGQIWWHNVNEVKETGPAAKWYAEAPLPSPKQ